MVHELKILPEHYEAVRNGEKKFEVRYMDRNFQVGDYLALNEVDSAQTTYTGRSMLVKVTYILNDDRYCKEDFVIMGFVWCSIRADDETNSPPTYEIGGNSK